MEKEYSREEALKAFLAIVRSFGKSQSPQGLQLLLASKLAAFGNLPKLDAGQIAKIFMSLSVEERKLARLFLQEMQLKTKPSKQGRASIPKRLTKHNQSFV